MPSYRFIGPYPRFYPSIQDAEGKSLMAELGAVVDFDGEVPSDGQWVLAEDAPPVTAPEPPAPEPAPEVPPAGPEPAVEAVEPEPAADVAPSDPGPAPAVSEPTPEPVVPPEVPAPEVQPAPPVSPAQGFILGRTPFARS